MKGSVQDVQIDGDITYSLTTESFNKPLKLVNHSAHTYIFKIKTNQRTVVSLQTTHDFLPPHSTRQIATKLSDKPSQTNPLKLEFNYAIAKEQDLRNKDSKMTGYPSDTMFKKVISVQHNENPLIQEKLTPKKQHTEPFSAEQITHTPNKQETLIKQQTSTKQSPHTTAVHLKFEEQKPKKIDHSQEIILSNENSQIIDIAEMIEAGRKKSIGQIQKDTKPSPQPIAVKAAESLPNDLNIFKKVESQAITIPQQIPKRASEGLPSSNKVYLSNFLTKQQKSDFKLTESVFQAPSKEKNQNEMVLAQLDEKIQKQKQNIQQLQHLQSGSISIYPFPIILALIITFFALGSFFNYLFTS